jgi:DNA-binding SARP family transcriptional activator
MQFWLLGPLEVSDGDRPLPLGGPKRRALLALLVLKANEVVSTSRLAEELWGERVPANASGSIHNHVSRLRKELGAEILATNRWGYVLRTPPESIDVCRFERAVAEAEALPAAERSRALGEALALWRGPPLADLVYEPGLSAHIARLEELRFAALEQRIDADLESGRAAELVAELEALVAASPLREHFRWQLILALYRSGRQAEGLEIYRETRRLLADELGLEPSPELRELERAVLRQDPALALPKVPHESAAPARTQRARRRARAAMIATLALGAVGAAGYALATTAWKSPAHARAAATVRPAPRTVTQVVVQRPRRTPRRQRSDVASARVTAHRRFRPAVTVSEAVGTQSPAVAKTTRVVTPRRPATHAITTTARAPTPPPTTTASAPTTTTAPPTAAPTLADPRGWWTGGNQPQVVVTQAAGAVTVDVPATAKDGFDGVVQTRCRVQGDFDARVSFQLLQWPGADGVWLSLAASDLGGVNAYRTDAFGESYGTYVPPTGGTSVPAAGSSGALRLTRHGSEITGWYDGGAGWVTVFSGTGATAPTAIALGVFNLPNVATFAGRPVSVRFDSFVLDAGALEC